MSYRSREAIARSGGFNPSEPLDANTNAAAAVNCAQFTDSKKIQADFTALLRLTRSEYAIVGWPGANEANLTGEFTSVYYPGVSGNAPIYRSPCRRRTATSTRSRRWAPRRSGHPRHGDAGRA